MLFAGTLLRHLIIFCPQTCQRYYERVICSISTTGSSKSVQNSLYNDTFFLMTYSTFSPPFTTLLVRSPQLHCIATLLRYNFWYVDILFDQFKLILMTCIAVAELIFAFSPITPCRTYCSTTGRSFISFLRMSLLVYKQFILSAQIDGIDLPFCFRFFFRYFAFLTTCSSQSSATACGIHQHSVDFIYAMYVSFYV